jgi:hypothetical protein
MVFTRASHMRFSHTLRAFALRVRANVRQMPPSLRRFHASGLTRAQDGWTALIYAAVNSHADCARLLLNAGADKEAKDVVRRSRLDGACGCERVSGCLVFANRS